MIENLNGSNPENRIGTETSDQWPVGRVVYATLITLGIGFIFFLFYQFYTIVFLCFVAITLAIAIRPVVDWLRRRGLPEGVGVLSIYALVLVILIGLALLVGPLLIEQINTLVAQVPEYYRQLRLTLADSGNPLLVRMVRTLPAFPALPTPALAAESSPFAILTPAWEFIRTAGYIIFVFGAVLLLAFYWSVEGELITRRALFLLPINRREEARTLMAELGGTIGDYFRGQAILCGLVGLLSLIGYWAVGLPFALGLALVMTVFEAIPMIGPTLGAIPAVLVAFSTAPELVPWVIGVVLLIQTLENNLLVPRVMNDSVGVNPIVSILAIAAFGALFGVVGAILAIPLAAMLQIVLNRLFFRLPSPEELLVVAQSASGTERTLISKMRLQAQELVLDARKGSRTDEGPDDPVVETIEDSIEELAMELETLLGRAEQPA